MRVVVDGRRVGNSDDAVYYDYVAYFKKRKLNKRNVLHEFYHHLAFVYDLDLRALVNIGYSYAIYTTHTI